MPTRSDEAVDATSTLERLHRLPDSALFTSDEASLYLSARRDLLRSWRWQGRGPAFVGRGRFIRYRKRCLDEFLAGYAGRSDVRR